MAQPTGFSVRVNRTEGTVEIDAPDGAWVAEQLEKLMPVLTAGAETPTRARPPRRPVDAPGKPSDTKSSAKPKTRSRRGAATGQTNPELAAKLTVDVKTELASYWDERKSKAKDAQSQAPVIATFLLDNLSWPEVTADDLFTVYSEMGWKIPATRSALQNATSRKGYFSAPDDGKYRVSHTGQNFARHDSKS